MKTGRKHLCGPSRPWRDGALCCVIVLAICPVNLSAGPSWVKPALSLGSLDVNGGLRQRFELGVLSGSPEFSFPVFLEHTLLEGSAASEYRIPQLETYVVPEGRDAILWLEPGGNRHVFKTTAVLKTAPERQKEPWVAIKAGADGYDFRSNDGWTYRYEAGTIVSQGAPTGRELRFETNGLRIHRIFQRADDSEITLLVAKENDIGQPESLSIGPITHDFQYAQESDRLIRWHSPQMGMDSVSFSYSPEGLVQSIALPGGHNLNYQWGGSDGAWQKDSGFELPATDHAAFLIADNDFTFQYGITKAGINLMRSDKLGIREGFSFNPRTQQLVRKNRDGGEVTEFFGLRGPSANRLESARDARGRETVKLTYDDKGRVLTRTVPGRAEIRYEYDDLDRITKVFRLKQLQTAYEYECDSEKPVKITNALNDTIEITYMPDGQVKRYKNLDGAAYEFIYDSLGQLTEERHPMGYKKNIERDRFGRVTHIREIDGRETKYGYTKENRLDVVHQNGSTWQYEYDPDGQLARLLRDGETWQKTEREKIADSGGTIIKETNSRGDETVYQLDKTGHVVKQVDALGHSTSYKRDALGQLKGWEDPKGSIVDFERDALGRIAGVETGEAAKLEFAYDLTGRIRRKNNGEQDIRFDYDKAGRLVKIDYGKDQTIDYSYDDYGRVLTALTGQGVKTTYTWDALDRKTSERNDIPGMGYTLLEWTYTPSGRKKSVSVWRGDTPVSSDSSTSKIQNQQSTIVNPSPSSFTTPISSSPSTIHNPQSMIAAPAAKLLQKTTYAYDDLGRYSQISVNDEPRIWYDYDPKTLRLLKKRFWNDWLIAYGHFDDGYPKSIVATDDKGQTVTDCHYIWRKDGKLDQRILYGIQHQYRYDPLGRLTKVIKTKPDSH